MTADAIGGVWTYALELCRAFEERGVRVGLATMGKHLSPSQRNEVNALSNVRLFESAYKLEWMPASGADLERAGRWLLEVEAEFRPDLVHLNSFVHGALPWRAPKMAVGHSCVLSWWRAVHGTDAPGEWDEYREWVMAGLHGVDLVVAPTRAMLITLNELYGPFKASAVIPNGRRLTGLQLRSKHNFILSAGRLWDEAKNIGTLAAIAARLPWPVYAAGEDEHPSGIRPPCEAVHRLGHLPPGELLQYYERASIYALPARYEPFGLSVLEAALAGCALVLGNIPTLRETWADAAIFVEPNDPAALEGALRDLIEHPEMLGEFSARARCRSRQFTPERMSEEYLSAGSLLTGRVPARAMHNPSLNENRPLLSQPVV